MKFLLQIAVFMAVIFTASLLVISPQFRTVVMSPLGNHTAEPLTTEEIKIRQDKLLTKLKSKYSQLGPYWTAGASIVPPNQNEDNLVPLMPYGPFFLPRVPMVPGKKLSIDLDNDRYYLREALFNALINFYEDRCSADLRETVKQALNKYRIAYFRYIGEVDAKQDYPWATTHDQHLVGALIVLVNLGFLTWDDIPPPRGSNVFVGFQFTPENVKQIIEQYKKRQGCPA